MDYRHMCGRTPCTFVLYRFCCLCECVPRRNVNKTSAIFISGNLLRLYLSFWICFGHCECIYRFSRLSRMWTFNFFSLIFECFRRIITDIVEISKLCFKYIYQNDHSTCSKKSHKKFTHFQNNEIASCCKRPSHWRFDLTSKR